jgi:N-acetylneuraminic acid mutarotase
LKLHTLNIIRQAEVAASSGTQHIQSNTTVVPPSSSTLPTLPEYIGSMEPGVVAAAYGVETAIEGSVGAAVAIARATMPVKATWRRIRTDQKLPRSSHSLSVIKSKAYIFGGEEKPREPVENHMHVFTLPSSEDDEVDYQIIPAVASAGAGDVPPPRVGHTASKVDDRIYVFGGRGGKEMKPLEEQGRVWVYDTKLNSWSFLDPSEGSPFPDSRSYHASTSTEHPMSQVAVASASTKGPMNESPFGVAGSGLDDHGTIFIHGGCPASGRVADVWAFDIASKTWSRYPDPPGPARGGPCLTFTRNRLYRFGGFDGKQELGGPLQYLSLTRCTFDDEGGKGELGVAPLTGQWETVEPPSDTNVPGNRSVAGLQPVTSGQGRNYLLLSLGERDPSSAGHEAAGKFWDDVWSFQLPPDGMTAASLKDATKQLFGGKTAEGTWARCDIPEASKTGHTEHPGQRGWFASDRQDTDFSSVIIWGGVTSDNSRAGDGWILTVQP